MSQNNFRQFSFSANTVHDLVSIVLRNKSRLDKSHEPPCGFDMAYLEPVSYTHLDVYKRQEAYRMIIRQGVDIIESDRPIEVAEAISSLIPVSSSKGKFFSTL